MSWGRWSMATLQTRAAKNFSSCRWGVSGVHKHRTRVSGKLRKQCIQGRNDLWSTVFLLLPLKHKTMKGGLDLAAINSCKLFILTHPIQADRACSIRLILVFCFCTYKKSLWVTKSDQVIHYLQFLDVHLCPIVHVLSCWLVGWSWRILAPDQHQHLHPAETWSEKSIV